MKLFHELCASQKVLYAAEDLSPGELDTLFGHVLATVKKQALLN